MTKIGSLFGIALGILALGSTAQAAQRYSYKTKGNTAAYSVTSSTDCGYQSLSIYVFEQRTSGDQTVANSVNIDYSSYDFCTGIYAYGYGVLDNVSYDVKKLQSASADATGTFEVVTCDYSQGGGETDGGFVDPCSYSSESLAINLDWVGTGDTYKDRYVQVSVTPSARYRYKQTGQSREAAVTGSVSVGGSPISLADGYGTLSHSTTATLEVIR